MVQALVEDFKVDANQQTDVTPLLMATQNRRVETGRQDMYPPALPP